MSTCLGDNCARPTRPDSGFVRHTAPAQGRTPHHPHTAPHEAGLQLWNHLCLMVIFMKHYYCYVKLFNCLIHKKLGLCSMKMFYWCLMILSLNSPSRHLPHSVTLSSLPSCHKGVSFFMFHNDFFKIYKISDTKFLLTYKVKQTLSK